MLLLVNYLEEYLLTIEKVKIMNHRVYGGAQIFYA